ncbi:MAG: F0F1 ATP synthase subunit delta, partial [Vibrio sp.]|nr:F0F1 ATP synthase subunit delta [Vibrio sp.]
LDFEINPEILGGALISFNGKYLDESLSKKMEEIFSNQKEELLKTLN